MRVFIIGLAALLIILPTLLILFGPGQALRKRVFWAVIAFVSPIVMIGLVWMIPILTNNAPHAAQWQRFVGLILSGGGFVLPWVIFALFLHRQGARS